MSFDGSDFVGLDDELVANSADADAARPFDAVLDWSLRSNERWLIEQGHRVSLVPYAANAGDYTTVAAERGACSAATTTLWLWPWIYQAGLNTITASGIASVADQDGSDTLSCQVRLRAYDLTDPLTGQPAGGGRQNAALLGDTTSSQTPICQDFSVTLDLAAPSARGDYIAPLQLMVLSEVGSTDIDTATGSGTTVTAYTAIDADTGTEDFYADTGATRPNGAALDLQCTRLSGDTSGDYDHLQVSAADDDIMIVAPQPDEVDELALKHLGYAHLRGLHLESSFTDTTLQPDDVLRAQQPLVAEVAQTHLIRRDNIYRRARPLWLGPQGYVPGAEGGWPSGYTGRWPRVDGDNTDGALFSANVLLDSTDPRVRILAYVLGYEDTSSSPFAPVPGEDYPEALIERAGEAAWVFGARALGLEDGDANWAAATSLADTTSDDRPALRITHYPLDPSGRSPFLRQQLQYEGSSTYTFREGQLFPEDLVALGAQITLVAVDVDLTYTVTADRPIRIDLVPELTQDVADLPGDVTGELISARRSLVTPDPTDFHLVCVGASIWELPR